MSELNITDAERAELTAHALDSLNDYKANRYEDAWYGIVLRCSGRTFDVNIYGGEGYDLQGMAKAVIYPVNDKGETQTQTHELLWCMPVINTEGETTFNVSFTLTRSNSMREHDETYFDTQCISDEITSWLTDLDFKVSTPTVHQVDPHA